MADKAEQLKNIVSGAEMEKVPGQEKRISLYSIIQAILALVLLVILSPLIFVTSVLVKINSAGPVFYLGPRVGLGNRVFKLVKFRTLPDKYEYNVGSRILKSSERHQNFFTKIIVRIKLDELPQLYNVMRGEMAFVGPRPVRPVLFNRYRDDIKMYSGRFLVRPGITGLAQIVGGYYMDPLDKHYYDMLYIRNKSVVLDIKIVILTVIALLLSRRIMKTGIVKRFLGLEMNVRNRHIDPSSEVMDKVTSSDEEKELENDTKQSIQG